MSETQRNNFFNHGSGDKLKSLLLALPKNLTWIIKMFKYTYIKFQQQSNMKIMRARLATGKRKIFMRPLAKNVFFFISQQN